MAAAWNRIDQAYRPSTSAAHRAHFKTLLSFLFFTYSSFAITLTNILVFLKYLYQNQISPKVIKNYLSSISTMAKFYQIDHQDVFHLQLPDILEVFPSPLYLLPTPLHFTRLLILMVDRPLKQSLQGEIQIM